MKIKIFLPDSNVNFRNLFVMKVLCTEKLNCHLSLYRDHSVILLSFDPAANNFECFCDFPS